MESYIIKLQLQKKGELNLTYFEILMHPSIDVFIGRITVKNNSKQITIMRGISCGGLCLSEAHMNWVPLNMS